MSQACKILAVDDHAPNLAILEEMLGGHYQLDLASSGEEALDAIERIRPDILLLDIMMPGIDGYEVCRRIRSELGLGSMKIIMVSAKASVQERLKAYDVGADDYVTKPFDEDELASKVKVYARLKAIEEINRLKREVLGLVASQLRTPLCAISLPAELVRDEGAMDPQRRQRLGRFISYTGRRLERLFRKLALLGRIRSGAWTPTLGRVDVRQLFHDVVERSQALADERRVRLIEEVHERPEPQADAEVIRFALESLLDVAVFIAEPESEVVLEACSGGGETDFAVGVRRTNRDPAALEELFELFREPDPECDIDDGHALGLALAREIFARHGGDVRIGERESYPCVFELTLPRGRDQARGNSKSASPAAVH